MSNAEFISEKNKAINNLMKKLAEAEKSAEENGWLSNDDVKEIIKPI